jgi:2-polyprenyl-3-methyl-5-hydroxy-6-metoxy-1,4-benzoquinol methylase
MERSEYQAMLDGSERHWWYRGRRRIVLGVLERAGVRGEGVALLDAGCGSGRMLDDLARYGHARGIDSEALGVDAARGRGHDVCLARVEELPYERASFDVVTCLDVIEHTPDDVRTLAELRRVTRPGGSLVLTVPAYPALWSRHDELNHHFRRYSRRALRRAAAGAGWHVEYETHFNGVYLLPAALVRLALRLRPDAQQRSELALTPASLDRLLELPLRLEAALIARGASLPAGLSLLAVLRAPAAASVASAAEAVVDRAA